MKTICSLLLFCALACTSCNQHLPAFPDIFVGSWQMDDPELKSYDVWEKTSDTVYSGKSYTMGIQKEKLALVKDGDDWYYISLVEGQNNGEPIAFKLIKQTKSKFIFENKQHDFPKQIEYNFRSENNLVVYLRGNGKEYEQYFNRQP